MTLRSLKNRRITARSGQAAATADDARRAAKLAFALAVGMIPLLYYFTSTADGSEPGRSSLKWRASGSRTTTSAKVEAAADSSSSAEPLPLAADEAAKPIERETKRSTDMRRDNQVRLTQATNPLKAPPTSAINDPFGDGKSPTPAPAAAPQPIFDKLPTRTGTNLPPLPRADELAIANGGFAEEKCPELKDLKPISAISNVIAASEGDLPRECYFDETVISPNNRNWMATTYTWKASGLCHKPLYFEEVALERYGHSTGPISQPIVSGAHFFATLPLLPYKMGLNPPWECKYALGYYRPGSCAPYIVPPVPISGQAIAAEAAAVSGVIFLFP